MNHAVRLRLASAVAAATVTAGLAAPLTTASAGPTYDGAASEVTRAAPASGWTPRPEQYPGTVRTTDIPIRMDDGVVLRADLMQPANADGEAVGRKLPVIVTITAYNKTAHAFGAAGLAGPGPEYLVKRGYHHLLVDARGTGSSDGTWGAFGARENKDAGKVVAWAHRQDWSSGKVGMSGPSYMGISQLMAAGHHPPGLKAIFPVVPGADVYRDLIASGGQIDVGFMPLWLSAVTVGGLAPPAYAMSDPTSAIGVLIDHLIGGGTFTLPLGLQALFGQDPAYDGPFYRERSAIEYIGDVTVPTFLVGGEHDLFQRGTPMVFEELQRNGAPVKMILGPWDHLEGSTGDVVAEAGLGTLEELQLRWFDHWIKGRDGRLREIAPITYFEQGPDRWRTAPRWVDRGRGATTRFLSGTSMQGGQAGGLRNREGRPGQSTLVPLPVSGLCTRSANQWTAGIMNQIWPDNPCLEDNAVNEHTGLTFQTRPLRRPVGFRGPVNARLHVSSVSGDGMLAVIVSDVAPDGTVTRLTGGWQVISHRKLVRTKSRYLDGRLIQPWHPFTQAAQRELDPGQVAPVDVEVFPTAASIQRGHRLRISVQGYDVPHLLAPIPELPGQTLPITLHTGPRHRSLITLPGR